MALFSGKVVSLQSQIPTPRLFVVDNNPQRLREISQVLTRVVGGPRTAADLSEFPPDGEYTLMVAHYDGVSPEDRVKLLTRYAQPGLKTKLLLLSAMRERSELSELFASRALTNLVANAESVDVDEFIVTTQKILRADIFGIEKYFIWGVLPRTINVTSSAERGAVEDAVTEYTDDIGIPRRLAASLRTVLDEFLSNALYNGPVDANGVARFAHIPRTQEVTLAPHEQIELKLCCDGRRIGVSIRDSFGSLTLDTVQRYLAKCFSGGANQVDEKAGGAGLGFYQIFDALSHFVVNIEPGKCTEMIGLIDVRGSYKDFVMRGKSFNVFVA